MTHVSATHSKKIQYNESELNDFGNKKGCFMSLIKWSDWKFVVCVKLFFSKCSKEYAMLIARSIHTSRGNIIVKKSFITLTLPLMIHQWYLFLCLLFVVSLVRFPSCKFSACVWVRNKFERCVEIKMWMKIKTKFQLHPWTTTTTTTKWVLHFRCNRIGYAFVCLDRDSKWRQRQRWQQQPK